MSLDNLESSDLPGDFAVPTTLFGYDILGGLARGAGSILYYAQDANSPTVHVLKHVEILEPRDKRFYQQLRTEFLIGRRLNHSGLRRSLDLRIRRAWNGSIVEAGLLLEHCDGYTLSDYCPAEPTERLVVFLRAAMAVAALNDLGYVHCDIKPGNILVTEQAKATVIDLGQACEIGMIKERIQGTPNFMAPEQTRREAMTIKTDVFCFGATLYAALAGKAMPTLMTAGRGENSMVVDDMIPAPHTLNPDVQEDLSLLVMDCVRTRPERRPADMHEVVERLCAAGLASVQCPRTGT